MARLAMAKLRNGSITRLNDVIHNGRFDGWSVPTGIWLVHQRGHDLPLAAENRVVALSRLLPQHAKKVDRNHERPDHLDL